MKLGMAFLMAAMAALMLPAGAQDLSGLAPADEYFGRYNLSVLGIANSIRDAGARIDAGGDARAMTTGPLAFAGDAMKAWEQQYPSDPWIARDLLALESVYLKIPTDDGFRLASQTEAWLIADYPDTTYANKARVQLANAAGTPMRPVAQVLPSYAQAWERFAALRVPIGQR